jgi:hypothetical protein
VSLILAWAVFPLVLVALGAGWGTLVQRGSGSTIDGVLVVPLGWAALIIVTLVLTEWSVTAPAALWVVVAGAVVGLLLAWPWPRPAGWPLLAALGIVFVYGAPVLLTGHATFTGYIKLDDTGSFLDVIDHAMTNLHQFPAVAQSTYEQVFIGDFTPTYPLGSFMLSAIGHLLTGINAAWIVQPYMALCGAAVGLGVYALLEPILSSQRLRALVAFVAAQPALLYGYSLWGGQKEMTAAFLLVLGAALLARVIVKRPANPRSLLPIAVATAALILVLGIGAAAFIVPPLIVMVILWARRAWPRELKGVALDVGLLAIVTAALALPVWITVVEFLDHLHGLLTGSNRTAEEVLGNLIQPLSGWQLAGIWPIGDFRLHPATVPSVLLIGLVVLAALAAIWMTVRRRQPGILVYVGITLVGCAIYYLVGTTPWLLAKSLAISSPALLAAALTGGALLWSRGGRHRASGIVGVVVVVALAGGVLWSNALAYHDVTLAPRARLAELAHIGGLVAGKGPTFINEYEIYADRHFLHEGFPVEPAEYRSVTLPLRSGQSLTKEAWADLDSFPLSTLEPYRSIVTRRSPAESRPPSIYHLVWQGRYYQLWQRPAQPATRIIEHVPFGESTGRPFCGVAEDGTMVPLCSANPVAPPRCSQVLKLGRQAQAEGAQLVAYLRAEPIVVRANETRWPGGWISELSSRTLIPTIPGRMVAHIKVASSQRYELWLNGSFARGFEVSVDGRSLRSVKNELSPFSAYVYLATLFLTEGVHTFVFTYPHANDLEPGTGVAEFTSISAIALQPLLPPSELVTLAPSQAAQLCGRSLDWIELVVPNR